MAEFKALSGLLQELEEAELRYERKTERFDDAAIAAATAEFNVFLERAAKAVLADLGNPADGEDLLAAWRPAAPGDTWFGAEPGRFLRHILETGIVRRGSPGDAFA
jgi:hypothetical protein